ncbi:MAG TPA: methyltransferase domain-containing protein [Herpetosiphonaceae bacterium]
MQQPHPPDQPIDIWADSTAYDAYIGRWSRLVARAFLPWLSIEPKQRWLDIGSGSGALVRAILDQAQPHEIKGIDRSPEYVRFLRAAVRDPQVSFDVADAQSLPFAASQFDVVVSGLVLNFIPEPRAALSEMVRVTQLGGTIAAYVWDYAGQMQMLRYFWDAVVALDPEMRERDEARRFPICQPDALQTLFASVGLHAVAVQAIDIDTTFRDFDDYWTPFLGGQGPAPTYVAALPEEERAILRERIRARLPFAVDGSIPLVARAWAVRGRR